MKRLLAIVLIIAVIPFASVSAKTEKFTFNPVTFSDGTTGVIEAASKQTGGGSTVTICDYYTENWSTFLGYYQDSTFFSSNADDVKQFCLEHFVDRVQ